MGRREMDPDKRPDFIGNRNLVDAAKAQGIARFVLVTVIGAGDSAAAVSMVAQSHIVITQMNQPAGWEGAVLTLLVPHGCGPAATTEIRIKVPDNVNTLLPEAKAGWTLEITRRKLPAPIKVGNREITEVLDEVIWKGGSLPSDQAGGCTSRRYRSAVLPTTAGLKLSRRKRKSGASG